MVGYCGSAYLLLAALRLQVGAIALFHASATQGASPGRVVLSTLLVNELPLHPPLPSWRLVSGS